jgi:flagellin-like hook-associated protein FlgL
LTKYEAAARITDADTAQDVAELTAANILQKINASLLASIGNIDKKLVELLLRS